MPRACMTALVLTVALLAGAAAASASASKTGSCPVTIPTRTVPTDAGFSAAGFNYGNARLRAHLYWPRGVLPAGRQPDGGSYATVSPDGSIWVKLGWWRGGRGKLVIKGRRIDAHALPLRADVPDGYGSQGFVPSGLSFPTVGCWRIVGRQGSGSLTFVVQVTKLKEG